MKIKFLSCSFDFKVGGECWRVEFEETDRRDSLGRPAFIASVGLLGRERVARFLCSRAQATRSGSLACLKSTLKEGLKS